MVQPNRQDRLKSDFEAIQALKAASTLFDFETTGEPPERYTVTFRGKGVARGSSGEEVEIIELHRCDIRLPYSYPERGPDIRWLTPIFHPNISFSGFINLKQIGLPWEKDITLDVVVERLWDLARMAHVTEDKAVNYTAKNWFEEENTLRLPLDHRPLRDKSAPAKSNVIRYERRGETEINLPAGKEDAGVFYIGEDTPIPQSAEGRGSLPPRRVPPRRVQPDEDDDILYIG